MRTLLFSRWLMCSVSTPVPVIRYTSTQWNQTGKNLSGGTHLNTTCIYIQTLSPIPTIIIYMEEKRERVEWAIK